MASPRPRPMGLGEIGTGAMLEPRKPMPTDTPPTLPGLTPVPVTPAAAPPSLYASPADLTGRTFLGRAPTATPYGDFVAPDPSQVANDPYYQFRMAEGEKGLQRNAAARGTLLNGGTLKALERYRSGLASEEAGKAFDRALTVYGTNRDTNAQNFGQANTQFRGDLDVFGENNRVGMGWADMTGAGGGGSTAVNADAAAIAPGPLRTGPSIGDYAAQVAAARTALQPVANAAPAPPAGRRRPLNPLDWMSPGLYVGG